MALSILDGTQTATTLSTILSSGQHITAHTVVSLGTQAITDMRGAVSGSVVSVSSLPAISGTVTVGNTVSFISVAGDDELTANISNAIQGSPLPAGTNQIGTVTANLGNVAGTHQGDIPSRAVRMGWGAEDTFKGVGVDAEGQPLPIQIYLGISSDDNVTTANPLPISGTVTANSSNGSLTTRFGSVTTANTAFATSAVTNANRKYLLIQNITTASNVITIGIGFTPTTTQGIQLFSGAGLTFEGSYIPTGAVNLLSSVTASCYTILEA
jgi:hypothetical protein